MSRRVLLAMNVCLSLACVSRPDPATATATAAAAATASEPAALRLPEAEPPLPILEGQFVVAPAGAVLFADAAMKHPVASIPQGHDPVALHVVQVRADTIAVKQSGDGHCARSLILRWADIRLFVAERTLATVTARQVSHDFADGTRVRVGPGAMVGNSGEHVVSLFDMGGVTVPIELSGHDIARSYPAAAGFPLATMTVALGTEAAQAFLANDGFLLPRDTPLSRVVPSSGGVLARLQGPCVDATVRLARSAIQMIEPTAWRNIEGAFGVGGLGLVGTAREAYDVEAGTRILWPSGETAGIVAVAHTFLRSPLVVRGLKCFQPYEPYWVETGGELCFDAANVAPHAQEGIVGPPGGP